MSRKRLLRLGDFVHKNYVRTQQRRLLLQFIDLQGRFSKIKKGKTLSHDLIKNGWSFFAPLTTHAVICKELALLEQCIREEFLCSATRTWIFLLKVLSLKRVLPRLPIMVFIVAFIISKFRLLFSSYSPEPGTFRCLQFIISPNCLFNFNADICCLEYVGNARIQSYTSGRYIKELLNIIH